MHQKQHLSARFDPELIDRLETVSRGLHASIPDTISIALDALEREQHVAQTIGERVFQMERNLDLMARLLTAIDTKMDEASVNEKERLKSLLSLLKEEMRAHDEAELKRFESVKPRHFR